MAQDRLQKRILDTDERLLMALVRVSETFKKECDLVFKNYGLTFQQYNFLRVLEGSENGRNTMTNVSRIMLVSGANVTGIAKRLEKGGFIVRGHDPQDERLTVAEITPLGRQTLQQMIRAKDENHARFLAGLPEEQKLVILSSLKNIFRRVRG